MKYKVFKKGNGKFAPRIMGDEDDKYNSHGNWYERTCEYDTLEGAVQALKDKKKRDEEFVILNKEEVVFELE